MADGKFHYQEAERLLESARMSTYTESSVQMTNLANVHALLALAFATRTAQTGAKSKEHTYGLE